MLSLFCLGVYVGAVIILTRPNINFFPINILFIIFTIAIGMRFSNKFYWFLLIPLLLVDLFSILPFGLYSLSMLCGIRLMEKFTAHMFSDRSILPVLASSFTGMLIFRFIFSIFIGAYTLYNEFDFFVVIKANMYPYLIEALLTAVTTALLFAIVRWQIKKIVPGRFIIYEKG